MPQDRLLAIGELARRTAWRHRRCATTSRRPALTRGLRTGRRRHYQASSADRVALIRLYRDAGFTLAEIGRLLAAGSRGRRACDRLAEHKIAELDAGIADAQQAKKLIEHAPNARTASC